MNMENEWIEKYKSRLYNEAFADPMYFKEVDSVIDALLQEHAERIRGEIEEIIGNFPDTERGRFAIQGCSAALDAVINHLKR